MEAYLTSLGYDAQRVANDDYIEPDHPITDANAKKAHENNAKENNAILSGLKNSKFVKVVQCNTTKEISNKIKNLYEGMVVCRKKNCNFLHNTI